MASLREMARWEQSIYQIEVLDPVLGGENGVTNRPLVQLANRTLYLKTQVGYVQNLVNPKSITADSANVVDATGHSHEIALASTTAAGIVRLVDNLGSSANNQALTAKQGKILNDTKLGNTGTQTLNGVLKITSSQNHWGKFNLPLQDGTQWWVEANPNYKTATNGHAALRFLHIDGTTRRYYDLVKSSNNEVIAYHSWVQQGFVSKTTAETITGKKTFSNEIVSTTGNALRLKSTRTNQSVFFRFDGNHFYLMKTATGDSDGTWDATRPLVWNVATDSLSIKGSLNGNATTATRLATARTINGVAFDGTANITVGLPTFSTTINQSATTLTNANDAVGQGGFSVRHLTSTTTNKPSGISHAMMSCVYDSKYASQLATDWRTNKLYSRVLNNGQWTSWKEVAYTDGNVATASRLQTARTLSMTGDGTWSVSFNGSQNASANLTLANSGVTAGSYNAVTVDAKGRVTHGLTQTHGLITATSSTGTANVATNNTNTFLNIVASGVGSASSAGTSIKILGTNGISVSSDASGNLTITQTLANNLTDSSANKALSAAQGKVLNEKITSLDVRKFENRGLLHDKDLNTLKSIDHTGVWQQTGNSGATSARHYPIARAGTLFVLPSAYSGQQLYFPFDEAVFYKRTTNAQGAYGNWMKIGGLANTLGSTSTSDALTANQGKVLKQQIDTKLGNSGTQHLNGVLWVGQGDTWQKITFKDGRTNANRTIDLEINPSYFLDSNTSVGSTEIKFKFNDATRNGNTARYITFPSINNVNQNVAYHSWVQHGFLAKTANAASASKLQTARQITLTGAITGSVNFDGSTNVTMPTTLTKAVVREYNRTINGTASGQTTNSMSLVGQVVVGADGRITQYFHLKHFRDFWFGHDDNAVGYQNSSIITFKIPIALWTAMPNKILSVSAQTVRSSNATYSAQYSSEASEQEVAWSLRSQGADRGNIWLNLARMHGSASEYIDLFVVVEGY